MAETICPFCGHSPIPDGAETCPKCRRPFSTEATVSTNLTRTVGGALTGAVTANPAPTALALTAGALPWLARGLGFWGAAEEPWWVFLLAAALVSAAAAVMANVGPAKHLAGFTGVVEVAAAGVLWSPGGGALALAGAAHGVVLLAMTVAEPSKARLWGGLLAAGVAAAAGLGALATGRPSTVRAGPTLRDEVAGYELRLPAGWARGDEKAVHPHLRLPLDGGKTVNVAFHRAEPKAVGVLVVSRDEQPAFERACRDALVPLGVTAPQDGVELSPPTVFGKGADFRELKVGSGALGRFACALIDGRLVLLAVVAEDPAPGVGAAAFEEVAGGLSFR